MGVMEKHRDMRGYESVYVILEQIFCTRNDGGRFDAFVPASRDPPCYSLYVLSAPSTSERQTDADGDRESRKRQRERHRDRGRGESAGSLDTGGNLKRERNRPVQRARYNDCSLRLGRRTRYDKIDPPDRAIDLVNNRRVSRWVVSRRKAANEAPQRVDPMHLQ